jgi:hypothetical protein
VIFRRRPDVAYPDSMSPPPIWFSNLFHLWQRRRCLRVGHIRTHWPSCDHCGTRFAGSNDRGGWA